MSGVRGRFCLLRAYYYHTFAERPRHPGNEWVIKERCDIFSRRAKFVYIFLKAPLRFFPFTAPSWYSGSLRVAAALWVNGLAASSRLKHKSFVLWFGRYRYMLIYFSAASKMKIFQPMWKHFPALNVNIYPSLIPSLYSTFSYFNIHGFMKAV